jgi:hypothetical protein
MTATIRTRTTALALTGLLLLAGGCGPGGDRTQVLAEQPVPAEAERDDGVEGLSVDAHRAGDDQRYLDLLDLSVDRHVLRDGPDAPGPSTTDCRAPITPHPC